MGRSSSAYAPKAPAQSIFYQVVRDHFETFRAEAARVADRDGMPRFVEEDFYRFLRCGFLADGFARFHRNLSMTSTGRFRSRLQPRGQLLSQCSE